MKMYPAVHKPGRLVHQVSILLCILDPIIATKGRSNWYGVNLVGLDTCLKQLAFIYHILSGDILAAQQLLYSRQGQVRG